jgi:glucoamylase
VALRAIVDDFVHVLIRTQHVDSPAGNIFTGGLEEALFDLHIGQVTNGDYRVGSPAAGRTSTNPASYHYLNVYRQMIDGPPLRALVLIKYAEWLLLPEQNNGTWVADVLWPAINLDLQWISQHWNESSYVLHILYVTIQSSISTFIVGGISGGLPCGGVHTGRPLCNIARCERELASVA